LHTTVELDTRRVAPPRMGGRGGEKTVPPTEGISRGKLNWSKEKKPKNKSNRAKI